MKSTEFERETIAFQEAIAHKKDQESTVKTKFKANGKKYIEPKLESKKYRRVSRKVSNQRLEDLYNLQNLDSEYSLG